MSFKLSKYGYIRIAAVSPEMRVADTVFNTEKIIEAIDEVQKKNCSFILFPELCISGYTCADLFFQKTLLDASLSSLSKIAEYSSETQSTIIVGSPIQSNGKLFNCAIVISSGKIIGIIPKTYLCNTNEYYEERWFSSEFDRTAEVININDNKIPFGADLVFRQQENPNAIFGIEICEDLWAVKPPSIDLAINGAQVILNLSASNEFLSKKQYREDLIKMQSARCLSAYIYSSSGPGESTTDTVFSGHCIISEYGTILSETERFKFDTQIAFADIDIEKLNSERIKNNSFGSSMPNKIFRTIPFSFLENNVNNLYQVISANPFVPIDKKKRTEVCEEIFSIQSTALAKRIRHIDLKHTVIGLSGGLDSTLALLVILKTYEKLKLNKKDIIAINMPGFGTSSRTKSNADSLAEIIGVTLKTIPISDSVTQHFKDIEHNATEHDIVFENAQARERTQILMDIANKVNGIVIGTGDLSELALGWSTYNGDHISMYAVNSGVPKTLVKYIISWMSESVFTGEISNILLDIVNTPISPELLPANSDGEIQSTENTIGPFELHDFYLYYAIRMNFPPQKIIFLAETAFDKKYKRDEIVRWLSVFYQRFFNNQFKRSCMPDTVKVGSVSLSPRADWRMPSDAHMNNWLLEL